MTAERAATLEILSLISEGWKLKNREPIFNSYILTNPKGDIISICVKGTTMILTKNGNLKKSEVYKH